MKSSKTGSTTRLLSFVLIAILLISLVSFAAAGWNKNPENEPDSGNINSDNENEKADENKDGNSDNNVNNIPNETPTDTPNDPPVPEKPIYYNVMTGMPTDEEELLKMPIGFVQSSALSLYGISGADLTVEFPTENGETRLLSYTTSYTSLWKVGSLAPTRDYITNMSNVFGGAIVSYGSDDIVKYTAIDTSKLLLDLSTLPGSYFLQNTYNVYTSYDMVSSALLRAQNSLTQSTYKAAPFVFSDTKTTGTAKASSVIIPYSVSGETELYYSEKTGEYLYFKAGAKRVDMLNGQNIAYTNVFVLFADSTTYEKANGTELVLDTTAGGSGYYISGGEMSEICWSTDESGQLVFKTLDGNILKVNRGNSYIGYFKASNSSAVTVG